MDLKYPQGQREGEGRQLHSITGGHDGHHSDPVKQTTWQNTTLEGITPG